MLPDGSVVVVVVDEADHAGVSVPEVVAMLVDSVLCEVAGEFAAVAEEEPVADGVLLDVEDRGDEAGNEEVVEEDPGADVEVLPTLLFVDVVVPWEVEWLVKALVENPLGVEDEESECVEEWVEEEYVEEECVEEECVEEECVEEECVEEECVEEEEVAVTDDDVLLTVVE
ncbi:hypothetical protein CSOJ01_12167 [Colletotrichum sojae]|uniref:Uncharacterized protein n=1 Tax=Colletotrichum sojae TaxID=2175907 RepID=A0A8H6IW25_9PEZI|nr:hypothetical protein CSOJ01_12167 [Colletotrichum sojae]